MVGPTLGMSQQQRMQMVLAPQLRQSLEMLQVPIMELRNMIQEELETNPAIEDVRNNDISVEAEKPEQNEETKEEMDFDKEFEILEHLDDDWRDYFYQNLQNSSYSRENDEKRQFMLDSLPQQESLQEHLLEQLRMTSLDLSDQQIAEMIIGNIGDDGYLSTDISEISETSGADNTHLEELLQIIQEFHPTGVGSRNLRECLLLQLKRLGHENDLPTKIVENYIDELASHKIQLIARKTKHTVEEVQAAVQTITSLDPRPGRLYSENVNNYILPEVDVQKIDGEYVVIVDDDQLPHIRISSHYRKLLKSPLTKSTVKTYIRDHIRSGAFLIKSIHQRQKTIYRIATEIVSNQTEFLDHGISHLRPMTMSAVAEKVGVHETTVSRTVANKYMKTPSGIFEMKYFFTPGLKTAAGKDVSNKTVKDLINSMVSSEDPSKPLSDQSIQTQLEDIGIEIARRTVAKYRLMLRIPPSHMRRRF